jgi:hypothetical protein
MGEAYPAEVQALIDSTETAWEAEKGRARLWRWFGLSRASWLTLPRVLMHEMPEEWQDKMARLLEEFDDEFPNWIDRQYYVTAKVDGKFSQLPEVLCNYRHPRSEEISAYRKAGQ